MLRLYVRYAVACPRVRRVVRSWDRGPPVRMEGYPRPALGHPLLRHEEESIRLRFQRRASSSTRSTSTEASMPLNRHRRFLRFRLRVGGWRGRRRLRRLRRLRVG